MTGLHENQLEVIERIPMKGLRKVIAKRMRTSIQEKPQVTLQAEVETGTLVALKEELAPLVLQETGERLTLTHLLSRYVAVALCGYPRINGHVFEEEIVLYRGVNLGLAVALDDGLIVPVLRRADEKSLLEIVRDAADLTARARSGLLKPKDVSDATFTLSNLGAFGVTQFTPIVNPPEIAILGVNAIRGVPAIVDGALQERMVMTLSLSFDHAAIDGAQAAGFLQRAVKRIGVADKADLGL